MRRIGSWLVVGAMVALAASCGSPGGSLSDVLPWERDFDAAMVRAGSEGKPVMVDFYTDWCGWCKKLERETYTDRRVQVALAGFIPVKLNADREGRELAARMGVRAYPTLVFLDARGQEIGRIPGFMGPEPFLEEVSDFQGRLRAL